MNDEILIQYYYDDPRLSDEERKAISDAMNTDLDLRRRYEALVDDLDGLKKAEPVQPPPDMMARFHATIDQAATLERQRAETTRKKEGFHFVSFVWGGIVTAVLVSGIGIGMLISSPDQGTSYTTPPAVAGTSGAFSRGLQVHLAESNASLASLPVSSNGERDLLLQHIINQNRLFEQAAEQNGSDDLARVLRAMEPVLLQLASGELNDDEAAALQSQVLFELNVVLTKLRYRSSQQAETI